ncbi:MAG: DUF167 domain-containing protein [Georgfuchsia sp.]
MTWLRASGAAVLLTLHIQPGAKKTEVVGLHGDALKLRLAAPPVDGKANDALIAFLAARLDIPRSRLALVSGQTSRRKCVAVSNTDVTEIERSLYNQTDQR